jgi:hypothetical protein
MRSVLLKILMLLQIVTDIVSSDEVLEADVEVINAQNVANRNCTGPK